MTDLTNDEDQQKPLTAQEKFAIKAAQRKLEAKKRAQSAKEKYLARPEVQARVAKQRAEMAARRKKLASDRREKMRSLRQSAKSALLEDKKSARDLRQRRRDEELLKSLHVASDMQPSDQPKRKIPLYVINGGRQD